MKNYLRITDKIVAPHTFHDIEDIAEMLQEKNMYIITCMKGYKGSETHEKLMRFICSYSASYVSIRAKKINKNGFLVYSEHVEC